MRRRYPYENLLIKTLKGETWKDFKNYEGYYQVSSFGRGKSLDRIIPDPRLYQQFVEGRILKPKIVVDYNRLICDAMISHFLFSDIKIVTYSIKDIVRQKFNLFF